MYYVMILCMWSGVSDGENPVIDAALPPLIVRSMQPPVKSINILELGVRMPLYRDHPAETCGAGVGNCDETQWSPPTIQIKRRWRAIKHILYTFTQILSPRLHRIVTTITSGQSWWTQ